MYAETEGQVDLGKLALPLMGDPSQERWLYPLPCVWESNGMGLGKLALPLA